MDGAESGITGRWGQCGIHIAAESIPGIHVISRGAILIEVGMGRKGDKMFIA